MPLLPAVERVKGFAEVALGFTQETAKAEAERCLNCAGSLCRDACPYDVLTYDQATGLLQKCTLCAHRLDEGLEPFCVLCCEQEAIFSGDINDPASEVSQIISRRGAYVLHPERGTKPAIYYCPVSQPGPVQAIKSNDMR